MTESDRAVGVQEDAAQQHGGEQPVQVTVNYLPATKPFHKPYSGTTTLATVRTDATAFFGVRDRQERDKYEYFLEFQGGRITNLSQTLDQLLGPHRRGAEFNLIEQITPGAPSA
jgi:hypothetical protein